MIRTKDNNIFLSGDIFPEDSKDFIDLLDTIEESPTIYLNSGGGDVFAAKEMANACKRKKTKCIANGLVASAATYIRFASDNPTVYPDSVIMIHQPMTGSYGNVKDHKKTIEALNAIEDSMVETYMSHWKGSRESLKNAIDRETWYTGADLSNYFNINLETTDISFDNETDQQVYDKGMSDFVNHTETTIPEAEINKETEINKENEIINNTITFVNQTVIIN